MTQTNNEGIGEKAQVLPWGSKGPWYRVKKKGRKIPLVLVYAGGDVVT